MAESWPLPTTSAVGDPNFVPDFNQARENMNGLHAREAIYGTGSPEGVVTATIGQVFRNTEAGGYNGARVWRKDSGSGNTGWVVESGDTGWRNTSSSLLNGWTGQARLRRTGAAIEIMLNVNGSAATNERLLDLPGGFQAPYVIDAEVPLVAVGDSIAFIYPWEQKVLAGIGAVIRVHSVWTESSFWPSSLPGVAL